MTVLFVLTLTLVRRRIRLSFDLEAFWKSFVASIGMAIAVLLAQHVSYNRLLLPVYVILGACMYLAGLRLLKGIDSADVKLAKEFLGKRHEPLVNLLSKLLQAKS